MGKKRLDTRNHTGFIAVDGEGRRDQDGNDHYWLLRAGDQEIEASGEHLTTAECLDFLFACRVPGKAMVGFGLGYDWDHILRDLSAPAFRATQESKGAYRVIGGRLHKIQMAPRKWVTVYRWPGMEYEPGKGEKLTMYDVSSFFQCSFVKALKDWGVGTPESLAELEEMKSLRNQFAEVDSARIKSYNRLECILLAELMDRFDRVIAEQLDIRLRSYHGPGSLAKAMLKRLGIDLTIRAYQQDPLPAYAEDAIERAYFGGRFQCFQIGQGTPLHVIDLNSAYPHAATQLPSLGGGFEEVGDYRPDVYAIWLVQWDLPPDTFVTPFPWRDELGGIHYPPAGRGWYWGWEVAAAIQAYGERIQVLRGVVYHPPDEHRPFEAVVNKFYNLRLTLGKATAGIALKLFLNSIYGVLAQRPIADNVGMRCLLWAGMITSQTRARLFLAAHSAGPDAVMAATDGIGSLSQPDFDYHPTELGKWDETRYDTFSLYQPGIYRLMGVNAEGEPIETAKVRGVPIKDGSKSTFRWGEIDAIWSQHRYDGTYQFEVFDRYMSRRWCDHTGWVPYRWHTLDRKVHLRPGLGQENLHSSSQSTLVRWLTYDILKLANGSYHTISHRYRDNAPIVETIRVTRANINEEI